MQHTDTAALDAALAGSGFKFDAEESHDSIPTWVHESEPVWIREYEPVPGGERTKSNFYVFRPVHELKQGQKPWAADNRTVHDKSNPLHTLTDALAVAIAALDGGK